MALDDPVRLPFDPDRVAVARRQRNADLLGAALTVGDLMRILAALDPGMPLMLPMGEGGLAANVRAEVRHVMLAVNSLSGFGPHELAESDGEGDTPALVLLWDPKADGA